MSAVQKFKRTMCVLIGLLLIGGAILLYVPKLAQYRRNAERERHLLTRVTEEEELIKHLRRQQERFETDPAFVEQMAHERGLAKPNEVLFQFTP